MPWSQDSPFSTINVVIADHSLKITGSWHHQTISGVGDGVAIVISHVGPAVHWTIKIQLPVTPREAVIISKQGLEQWMQY